MPLCGYNDDMAKGLSDFGQGLAVQTDKRADEEGVPLTGIPAIELSELDIMVASLRASPKAAELEGIFGLTLFVRHLYRRLATLQRERPELSAQEAFAQIIADVNDTMFSMEKDYYENLRPALPKPEAIARITTFLESRVPLTEQMP